MRKYLLLVLFPTFFTLSAWAATHYADPGGDDDLGGLGYANDSQDHFLCYDARRPPGSRKFAKFDVSLADRVESGRFTVVKPDAVCASASRNGKGSADPATYLLSFRIKRAKGSPTKIRENKIRVVNRFGEIFLDTKRSDRLFVSRTEDSWTKPPASDRNGQSTDHYKCYRAKVTTGTPRLPDGILLTVEDGLENRLYTIRAPSRLCYPVGKDGGEIKDPSSHMLCYFIKPVRDKKRNKMGRGIHVSDRLRPVRLDTRKGGAGYARELCVPSTLPDPSVIERVRGKIDRVRRGIRQMLEDGQDPASAHNLMQQIPPLMKHGMLEEAEATSDRAIAFLEREGYPTDGPSTPLPFALGESRSVRLGAVPRNAQIIFWSTRDVPAAHILGPSNLYVTDKYGENTKQISFEPHYYLHAAVSPERTRVVACREGESEGALAAWLLDLGKQTEQRLLPEFFKVGSGGVDWSVDNWIYFAATEGDTSNFGLSEIYRMRPDGSQLTRLTDNPMMEVHDVSVSEDGTMVTHVGLVPFLDSKGNRCAKPQIWVLNADGTNHRMVDDGGPECGTLGGFPLGDFDPELSSDNRHVVFSRTSPNEFKNFQSTLNTAHDLWIAPLDGSAPAIRVTQPGTISIIPDWRDGTILYSKYDEREGYVGLVTMSPEGTPKRSIEYGKPEKMLDGARHGKWIPQQKRENHVRPREMSRAR